MKDDFPYMIKLFIRSCLFFDSRETINWILGALCWGSLALFAYAVFALIGFQ